MSFFAVQVRTGSEIAVKKMLGDLLKRSGDDAVKAIYALETFTQTGTEMDFNELTDTDISNHLFVQRIQASLSNLRVAYEEMKVSTGASDIMDEYRRQIKHLTARLKNLRPSSKKIGSVLKGYILIELENNFHYLPNHLWHLIKSIPKVSGFPSKMNIPQEEVDAFFEEVEMSPEVELQFNEILSYEEHLEEQNSLLERVNQSQDSEERKLLDESLEDMHTDVVEEVEDMKQAPLPMMKRVRAFIKNKREMVRLPVALFRQLYRKGIGTGMPSATWKSPTDFLYRLRRWVDYAQAVLE
ncbi:transcription termination/antitermination NusG family protein [Virgibacillus xinjiangensis]|uniref:Transcription termination/antitermination NusG family protein n=1 Tax=Virgibacillus xinjiangensis TaxID=393090 RepID=A0ABV7CYX1_9BACI